MSSSRITTCDDDISYVCFDDENGYIIMPSCNSSHNYVCLNETGEFSNCLNITDEEEDFDEYQTENSLLDHVMETDVANMQLLCSTSDGRVIQCINDPYILVTCLSTTSWDLIPCIDAEKESEIGIPVCVQVDMCH